MNTPDLFWGAFDLPESESGFQTIILIHRFILANWKQALESGGSYSVCDFKWINQDGGDGVLHHFIWATQKFDSKTSKSYSVQVSKQIKYIPWIIESKHSVCKVAGSYLWFWNHDLESCSWFGIIKRTPCLLNRRNDYQGQKMARKAALECKHFVHITCFP